MDWTALRNRLMNTCWILFAFQFERGQVRRQFHRQGDVMFLQLIQHQTERVPGNRIEVFVAHIRMVGGGKFQQLATMESARRMASRISVSTIGTVPRLRAAWTQKKITPARTVWSGFRTSCATPAASVPIDSSFSDWINCDWVAFSSFMRRLEFSQCRAQFLLTRASSAQAFFQFSFGPLAFRNVASDAHEAGDAAATVPQRRLGGQHHRCSPRGSMTGSS